MHFSLRNANFRFFAFSNISLVGILLASAISSFYLFDRFFSHSKGMTKNISRVHFCVNVKRNRSRMKPRNPASKENRGLQLEEKLPSVSRNSALIQQCTDSTNYGRVLQVRSRGSAWTRPVRKGDRLLVLHSSPSAGDRLLSFSNSRNSNCRIPSVFSDRRSHVCQSF